MFEKIFVHQWMTLDKEIRNKLAVIFSIPKSGITEILDNKVLSDGYTNTDLEVITLDRVKAYTGQKVGTLPELWDIAIEKLNSNKEVMSLEDLEKLPKPYCETCTSTMGRHRKGCPKYK